MLYIKHDATQITGVGEDKYHDGILLFQLLPEDIKENWDWDADNEERKPYENKRWILSLLNEGGCCGSTVDIVNLLAWLMKNRPDLIEAAKEQFEAGSTDG